MLMGFVSSSVTPRKLFRDLLCSLLTITVRLVNNSANSDVTPPQHWVNYRLDNIEAALSGRLRDAKTLKKK